MDISKNQLGAIYALIKKLKLDKPAVIDGATNGRTEHVSEMTKGEATALIKYLKSVDPEEESNERMRKKIISLGHEIGYKIAGTNKIDMKRLDQWCIDYGKFRKKLDRHTHNELAQLVTQFKAYASKFKSKF